MRRKAGWMPTARGIILAASLQCFSPGKPSTMSLSSAFRAVGNDPGIITWRIEVSSAGVTPFSSPSFWGQALVTCVCLLTAFPHSTSFPGFRNSPTLPSSAPFPRFDSSWVIQSSWWPVEEMLLALESRAPEKSGLALYSAICLVSLHFQ